MDLSGVCFVGEGRREMLGVDRWDAALEADSGARRCDGCIFVRIRLV